MPTTLARALSHAEVDDQILIRKFKPVAGLVEELLGLHPNADRTLAIWPPGLRTYQLLVPNLMNLPQALFSGREWKGLMGLSMYYASKTADCRYCTAHTCTLVLRRGGSEDALRGRLSPKEKAVADLASAVASIPANVPPDIIRNAKAHFSETKVEWIVYAASLMGFLNKVMETLGVELEGEAIHDVGRLLKDMGWDPGIHAPENVDIPDVQPKGKTDNLSTYLKLFRFAPGAIRLEKGWTKGVPGNTRKAKSFLLEQTGYDFPFLDFVKPSRVTRALTTVLKDHLDPEQGTIPLYLKFLSGLMYAQIVQNSFLPDDFRKLLSTSDHPLSDEQIEKVLEVGTGPIPESMETMNAEITLFANIIGGDKTAGAVLLLSKAASYTPSNLQEEMISMITEKLSPEQVVEIVTWIGLIQFLQRAGSYFHAADHN